MKGTTKTCLALMTMAAVLPLSAQDVPLQRPEEKLETRRQSVEVFDAIGPVARKAANSTVWVWANRRQVALGTVVGDGTQVLTKWSEIGLNYDSVQVVGGDGREARATILGVYQDEDLALLQLEGAQFTPIEWSDESSPTVGRFLVAAGPDSNALGIGAVAVAERVLRETDQAYLGIRAEQDEDGSGVVVVEVIEDSAAEKAGLKVGDELVEVGDKGVDSAFELRNALLEFSPGDRATMKVRRFNERLEIDEEREIQVEFDGRPEFPQFPQARLNTMRRMGGPLSVVGSGFPVVIQTDMKLKPDRIGGPILDLSGKVIGMSIARTDRTRSFIIPAGEIATILGQKPIAPEDAELPQRGERQLTMGQQRPRPRAVPMNPGSADTLRRHLEEMQDLLERMEREMQEIGE
ncbi:MAG: PDZ domain-containing protein [Verrucomicrobiota bacterium]